MFCKFGSVEEILPVVVIVWLNDECILLLIGFIIFTNPSTYVDFNFTICLYSVILSIISCLSLSFSKTSALVEYPV